MALPVSNIELYEALKRDLNEDAARMIAEVVPKASDVATKGDIAALKTDFAELKTDIAELKSHVDSRLLRYTLLAIVPLMVTMLGTVGALVGLVIKL